MKEKPTKLMIPEETITSKIYYIRGQKVMIDRDLAKLYEVKTKVLKQSVKRNLKRFPVDFMFKMTEKEFENWRSQFVTSNSDKMGLRHYPFCFTEQGVTMLSCILNSKLAIEINIRIIRVFTKMREMLLTHKEILLKLEQLEKKIIKHDDEIEIIFNTLRELIKPPIQERKRIGYKVP
ncbi:MAG: ORF6N domain-containing protein [Bacteroidales bacterium]|nr:ORF6N domain-containing protein [Bacteroidales bacterium]